MPVSLAWAWSEVEVCLQVDDATRRGGRKRVAAQIIRFAEQRRAQNTGRRGQIHLVEDIPSIGAEG